MALTDTAVRQAKGQDKTKKFSDGGGLFLELRPNGSKYWRLAYRYEGKQKLLALGVYPAVSLAAARQKRNEAKEMLAKGIDPAAARKEQKESQAQDLETFELIAREWQAKFTPTWSPRHADSIIKRLELYVFPWIGDRPISAITAPEILSVLRRLENRGVVETAHRMHQTCGQVFRYAVATGRAERNPCADLRGAIPPASKKHMATITDPKEIAGLLRAIDGYTGTMIVRCAFRFSPLVFCRPGEVRHAEWTEIDFDAAEWRIPGTKMKMKGTHIVPLSEQAIAILQEIHPLTGTGRYVFPSARSAARPMSENAISAALKRMGYTGDDIVPHGFRSMASTLLNEQGWNRDAIERQLAHAERNSVRAAYNHAEFMPERKKMMQAWSDYLDAIKVGAKIIPMRASG